MIDGYSKFLAMQGFIKATASDGTPSTLQQAIDNAVMIGPASAYRERIFYSVKDFLANKFGGAILKANGDPVIEEHLFDLFNKITKEERK